MDNISQFENSAISCNFWHSQSNFWQFQFLKTIIFCRFEVSVSANFGVKGQRSKVNPEPEFRGNHFGFPEIPRTRGVEKFRGIGMPTGDVIMQLEHTEKAISEIFK